MTKKRSKGPKRSKRSKRSTSKRRNSNSSNSNKNKKLYKIKKSSIHGKGLFATTDIACNKKIDCAIILLKPFYYPLVTDYFGVWINHAPRNGKRKGYRSNTTLKYDANKDVYYTYATRPIMKGEEILTDYNYTPWFIKKPDPLWET